METLEENPNYKCCCGIFHVVIGTKIVCILFLLRIALFIYANFPRNIPSAALIALITVISLIGTFFKQPILILPLYLILALAIGGSVVDILVTITQLFLYKKQIIIFDAVIQILTFCLLLWLISVVKNCYKYFKWIKFHKNLLPLRNLVHYFNNVLPNMPEKLPNGFQNGINNFNRESSDKTSEISSKNQSVPSKSSENSKSDNEDVEC